jgi:NitT/TauT family transport system permease protein
MSLGGADPAHADPEFVAREVGRGQADETPGAGGVARGRSVGRARGRRAWRWLGYLVSLLLGFGGYYLASILNPNVPSYHNLAQSFSGLARTGLLADIGTSLLRVAIGFAVAAVAGTAVGCVMGWYEPVRVLLEPWVQFIRMIPSLAFIPLFIVFLGVGELAKVVVIGLSAFLAITVSVMLGVRNVDLIYIRAARTLGASTGVMFRRVILPATLPYMLVGFRLGLANGWTTLVAAELLGATRGLGYVISNASQYNDTGQIIIAIIFIGIIGLIMDQVMHLLERRFGSWQERAR